jgi:hypothetical protein
MVKPYKTLPKRLEAFAEEWVPGLRTYLRREGIRDSDKLIRDELVKRLEGVKKEIDRMKRDWTDSGQLAGLDLLDRATRRIEKIRDSVKFASRGYSGIFDPEEVAEEELLALVNFDKKLFKRAEGLKEHLKSLKESDRPGIKAELRKLENKLTEFDDLLGQRDSYSRRK